MSQNKTIFLYSLLLAFGMLASPISSFAQDEQDAYDPFIDYSEYEESGDEEADINFFRNGRFLTLGMSVGQRGFTEGMADIYDGDVVFGLYLSYFFDLRFAMQFGYMTGGHAVKLTDTVKGDADISTLSVDFKYFINTQNVTKGLAAVNPYLLVGFASVRREVNLDGIADFSDTRGSGFNVGGGIEFPIMRNKMYIGAQGVYQLVNFKDENTNIPVSGSPSGVYPNGDIYLLTGVLGVNF